MIFTRFGDKMNKTAKYGVGGGGVSEIKCIIFNENPYEIHNNYIKLSIVFHPRIIFLGNKKI
jgi:hypothetical protein